MIGFIKDFFSVKDRELVSLSRAQLTNRDERRDANLAIIKRNDLNEVKQVISSEIFFRAYILLQEARENGLLHIYNLGNQGRIFRWESYEDNREYTLDLDRGLKFREILGDRYNERQEMLICDEFEMEFWEDLFEQYLMMQSLERFNFV